ncbi:hypothetical protein ACINWCA92_0126 [Acinetobacter baumannii WC-A-92]|nr:hypothetical protein ACINWCA92_0126 [Acinetobacter baumannii WC-A-92]
MQTIFFDDDSFTLSRTSLFLKLIEKFNFSLLLTTLSIVKFEKLSLQPIKNKELNKNIFFLIL